jgi:hypothetical protein
MEKCLNPNTLKTPEILLLSLENINDGEIM